jgi:pimeloyl-ACP methyl ester carboxylesterase
VAGVVLAAVLVLTVTGCNPLDRFGSRPAPSPPPPVSAPADRADPASEAALAAYYGQEPVWTDCHQGSQCATVTVPLDWDEPSGATLKLAVARKRATGTRVGAVFFNPGGPGVASIPYLDGLVAEAPRAMRASYDYVVWDTRGVGASEPGVSCLPAEDLDAFYAEETTPENAGERERMVSETRRYIAACEANTGPLLSHLDTLSTVRDMDVLRAVVGDARLNYIGASYGTYLGAWYAQTFPWRVGRLVLDGAVDPSLSSAQYVEGQARGFARAAKAYVEDCLASRECPLRGSRQDAYQQIARLLARADARALPTSDADRPLTEALLTTGMVFGMYSQQLWGPLTRALTDALAGDGTAMLALADMYLERDGDGGYGPAMQATSTIGCLDQRDTRTPEQVGAAAADLGARYPPFGAAIGWSSLTCALWPLADAVPQQKLTAQGAAPILVIGTTDDPATPYEWAQALAGQLSSARLLTRVGQGHTGYHQGNSCIDDAVDAYLLRGRVPSADLTCR